MLQRSYQPELLDLGPSHYEVDEYHHCLEQLHKIGIWLGGNAASMQALTSLKTPPASILDVGCGGGFFTLLMGQQFPEAKVVGIDVNPLAIAYAQRQHAKMANPPKNVSFVLKAQPELAELPKSYDVVIATLLCHHLPDAILIDFLRRAFLVARQKIIINDLQRHVAAYALFKLIAPICFRNRLVQHDGPLSIKRAFTKAEWQKYLAAAGIKAQNYAIHWRWAFRWLVEIDCTLEMK